jgi:hypothetical protein
MYAMDETACLFDMPSDSTIQLSDAYRCHISQAVKAECGCLNLQTSVVPEGCTKFIQAADVVWKGPFKSHMRSCCDNWLSEPSCHEYTKGGNMKAPSGGLLCKWVKCAWDSISTDMIKNSFLLSAITTSNNGSDDDLIHKTCHVLQADSYFWKKCRD